MSEKNLQKENADLKAENRRLKEKNLGLVFDPKSKEDVVEQCKTKIPILQEVKSKEISHSPPL